MRALVISVAVLSALAFSSVHAAAATPAGYIVEIELAGEDASGKTSVIRDGAELPVKLLMPVFDGDTIFVRDSASRIALELDEGEMVTMGGALLRYNVTGELATGDDTLSLLAAIADALGGDDGTSVPENMVSKGDHGILSMPLANRGANFVERGDGRLWLGWTGGTAPFQLTVEGQKHPLQTHERAIAAPVPETATGRFAASLTDASGHRINLRFRLVDSLPEQPDALPVDDNRVVQRLAHAMWLFGLENGAWRIAAAQLLDGRDGTAGEALRDAMRRGVSLPQATD